MMMRILLCMTIVPGLALAQSSSLYLDALEKNKSEKQRPNSSDFADDEHKPINPELEGASMMAVKTPPPNQFRVHDLVHVIVREQKDYRSDTKVEREKKFEIRSDLDQFFNFVGGHLGAATFGAGKPNINYKLDTKSEGEGDAERSDRLSFRIAVSIMDIKPNGLLVIAGTKRIKVDEDVQLLHVTGMCRSDDVTADNTVLSSQVFNQEINVQHEGPLNDAAKRGWLTKLLDVIKPI
jgi:flagellar L-ring protein precursor FlgH